MYITQEQLNERLSKTDVLYKERTRKNRATIKDGKGEDRLTHEERSLIGVLESLDTQKNVAALMGVSSQTVSNVSRGLTSPSIGLDKNLLNDVEEGKANIAKGRLESEKQIQDQLVTNLASALGHVANNLYSTDAVEASKIATDMSKILDRVSGQREGGKNRTAIIINVPAMKEEKSYQSITV